MFLRRGALFIFDFNPRPPRGGRHGQHHAKKKQRDFNPRPPRGGRPGYQYEDLRLVVISIHAPREGGDVPFAF